MELKALLISLATALPLVEAETVLGVYIFSRHGDRTPKALAPANLTSLGAEQVYSSGNYYRNRYVASDASSPVFGLSSDIAVTLQMDVSAPADTVLQNSATAFLQGLYPPVGDLSAQKLANDSSVQSPLNGYQYIPVSTAAAASSDGAEDSEWLQGNSGCGNAVASSNEYTVSDSYRKLYDDSKDFYSSLMPVLNSTFTEDEVSYKNAYTLYDYINVATIHNQTIPSSDLLTDDSLAHLAGLAQTHEWNLAYNGSDTIRAIAGATLAAQIVQQLNNTLANKGDEPLGIQFGSYGTFSSFFGLAHLQDASAAFTGVVDYASTMVFELVTNATVSADSYPGTDDVSVRFLFANGTAADSEPQVYPLFGGSEQVMSWTDFAANMGKFAIGDTADWCHACGNSTGTCAAYADGSSDAGTSSSDDHHGSSLSLTSAGVIGAFVTLAVILGVEGLLMALLGLRLVKKSTLAAATAASTTTTTAGAKA